MRLRDLIHRMTVVYDPHGVLDPAPNRRLPAEQPADADDPGAPAVQTAGERPHPG